MENYKNTETKMTKGGKTVRKVIIKGNQGYKSITKYVGGKKMYTVKKTIKEDHIQMIKGGKFIKGLFKDCVKCNSTRKNSK